MLYVGYIRNRCANLKVITKVHTIKNRQGNVMYTLTAPPDWVRQQGLENGGYVFAKLEGDKIVFQKVPLD